MTKWYKLTKAYLEGKEIEITYQSWRGYRRKERNTLEHLVEGEIITRTPLIKGYRNYSLIYYQRKQN